MCNFIVPPRNSQGRINFQKFYEFLETRFPCSLKKKISENPSRGDVEGGATRTRLAELRRRIEEASVDWLDP